jgi:hypothetical protein
MAYCLWFAVLVAGLVGAGVVAQIGWPVWQMPLPKLELVSLRKKKRTEP